MCDLLNNKLKNKKSSGYDEIPVFLLKRILDVLAPPLVYLVNLSFSNGIFSEYLKTGKVIPIHKKKMIPKFLKIIDQ